MELTSTVGVSKIEFYPTDSGPASTLVIEHTTTVLKDGEPFACNTARVGYDVASAEGRAALTQALADSGIMFVTVTPV